jgi:iron complex outermembrane receptor protein
MKNHYFFLLPILCLVTTASLAQSGSIKGFVKTSDGKPAEYVHLELKGTLKGTATDVHGAYTIRNVSPGTYNLIASFVGLETKEQSIELESGEQVVADFILSESSQRLEEVVVSAQRAEFYKTEEPSSSLRIQTSLMETPQSILSVSSSLLRDQQVFVTTDVAKNVSGITTVYPYVGVYTDFNIRGTRAYNNKLRNGMPIPASYGMLQEDMSYVDNVEFVKGPAGFMLAQGEPGGMYNVVTKKPTAANQGSATVTMGSFGLFRTAVDVGGPMNDKVSYRLNVMGQKSGTHLDYGVNNRLSFAPVVKLDLTARTSLTAEYNFDLASVNGTFANLPTRNKQYLPRNFAVDDPAMDPLKLSTHFGFFNLQHEINDQWKATAQISFALGNQTGAMFYAGTWVGNIENDLLPRAYRYMAVNNKVTTAQMFLNGDLNIGSVNHKILLGLDGGMFEDKWKNADVSNVLPMDIKDPAYGLGLGIDTLVDESSLYWEWPSRTAWQAISIQDNARITDWLQLTLGARYTYYQYGYLGEIETDNVFTPRAAILVMPVENTSIYLMYDEAFVPQTGRTFEGDRFDPLTGNNLELGIKREWFRKRLFTQVSVYNIIKNNVLTADPQHIGFSIQRGQIKSKGLELDINGSISKNLSIIANYAYTDVKVTKDTDPTVIGSKGQAPVHATNLWLKYKVISGLWNGLGAAIGGSYYKDQHGWTTKANPEDPEVLFDFKSLNAALYYTIGDLSFNFNMDNITNEFNIYGGFDYNQGTHGEYDYISLPGRNWKLSAMYKF